MGAWTEAYKVCEYDLGRAARGVMRVVSSLVPGPAAAAGDEGGGPATPQVPAAPARTRNMGPGLPHALNSKR